ncbi:hypothetical protein ADL00_02860 [Streptomyces sp. AS58]|nr:hypothetical protein ADL00_02860 [Streptomyces sp. AS58]
MVGDRKQRVALQHEERFLEGVPVSDDVTTGFKLDDRDREMTGTIVRPEDLPDTDALSRFAGMRVLELNRVAAVNAQGSRSTRDLC